MTRRMLIDGAHSEEIRVVITEGKKLLDYDIESSTKTQNKGNIYLAKVMRVEPSLQAAFVDYGGNRHGFLAFTEIHPDYYQIPVEDREALKKHVGEFEEAALAAKEHLEDIDGDGELVLDDGAGTDPDQGSETKSAAENEQTEFREPTEVSNNPNSRLVEAPATFSPESIATDDLVREAHSIEAATIEIDKEKTKSRENIERETEDPFAENGKTTPRSDNRSIPRRYKIQEVIKRNQIILIQVVKEERGNKGAALTSYLSLAGRYCVLMPNVTRGNGGVSRKITSSADRRRMREMLTALDVPEGMGVIMRTAGIQRNKSEIKRDFDYLIRLWDDVRNKTLESSAPALVYEEGDLVKRAIRDLYTREVEEIWVEGQDTYQSAKKLMRMMMPSHAKRVQPYKDNLMPMFHRYQVENQIEAMHNPVVQLKSGGYLVLNPTEALVAIDVNSGRATKERNIEETATKTNLEAASEIAYQIKLRDLAGLIVIDFIDMEERSNQRAVEKKFKDSVRADRARIQVGRISNFGLLELSRQRMRPSLVENSTQTCPNCGGTGNVRSTESMTLHALRILEEEGTRMRSSEISLTLPNQIALYLLNEKRDALDAIESKYEMRIRILGNDSTNPNEIEIDRRKANSSDTGPSIKEKAEEIEEKSEDKVPKRKRPRRRRRKKNDINEDISLSEAKPESTEGDPLPRNSVQNTDEEQSGRRRRGKRGGRRRNTRSKIENQNAKENIGNDLSDGSTLKKMSTETRNKSAPKKNDSEVKKPEGTKFGSDSKAHEKPAKRGWWQRILD
ncbi:MAG: Rne/Rng family ribonuclease [Pseudomonadota bacterium]|nr:Rne/Rng family ribonuclease [Pseudomonadota bacterium]